MARLVMGEDCGAHPVSLKLNRRPPCMALMILSVRFQRTIAGSASQASHIGVIIICCG